ncbi:MAG: cupin domain-containing protein [Polyangiaceae bacterium]|nr:cupin domain-containing protein [Polyangiaceae bacterium]
MTDPRDDELDDFLRETMEAGMQPNELGAIAASLPPLSPSRGLRGRLMQSTASGRLARFAVRVAALLDLGAAEAAALLDAVDRPSSWGPGPGPGIALFHVAGGPAVRGAIAGFVRIERGQAFPSHRHLGPEAVLVVQGAFRDEASGAVVRAGDVARMPAGSEHALAVVPGPALVYLAVVADGVDIGGLVLRPDDGRL